MQTAPLERATIRVTKVFDVKAGRTRGVIKDDAGTLWSPRAKDMPLYVPGREYDVEFEINDKGGTEYRNIERGRVLAPAEPARGEYTVIDNKPLPMQNGSHVGTRKSADYYKPTAPADARRIFICGLVNAWAHNGRIDMTVEAVAEAVEIAGQAYDRMLG